MQTHHYTLGSSGQHTLNSLALQGGSCSEALVVDVSAGVQPVDASFNPIPASVQDLLSFSPSKRVRTILSMAARPQQDDYFAWQLGRSRMIIFVA